MRNELVSHVALRNLDMGSSVRIYDFERQKPPPKATQPSTSQGMNVLRPFQNTIERIPQHLVSPQSARERYDHSPFFELNWSRRRVLRRDEKAHCMQITRA